MFPIIQRRNQMKFEFHPEKRLGDYIALYTKALNGFYVEKDTYFPKTFPF